MSKKITFLVGAFVLGLGLGQLATPAFATDIDPAATTSENDPANVPVVTSETGDGEIDEPTDPSDDNGEVIDPDHDQDHPAETDKCDVDDETKCEDADEDEADTEMWPVYVSFGALGGALLLVIIINVAFGRKRK